jgi:hypothetical protein
MNMIKRALFRLFASLAKHFLWEEDQDQAILQLGRRCDHCRTIMSAEEIERGTCRCQIRYL